MNVEGTTTLVTKPITRTHRPARRWWKTGVLVLLLWPLVAWGAARVLIVSAPPARAEAMVVLAGSAALVERTMEAARLFREEQVETVLLTHDGEQGGWSSVEQRNLFFVEQSATLLQHAGVPADHIVVLPRVVSSTHEEAEVVRDYAARHGLDSLLVVTSGYHSRRALWTYRRVFAGSRTAVGLHPVRPGFQTPRPATWWLTPRGWRMVAGEYVKFLYYLARYGG